MNTDKKSKAATDATAIKKGEKTVAFTKGKFGWSKEPHATPRTHTLGPNLLLPFRKGLKY